MKKSDAIKNMSKIVVAGAAAIALCSVAFTGLNDKVLASELSKQESVVTIYSIKTNAIKASEDYVKENYEVIINKSSSSKDKSTLSAEAAAELGAEYIWNMYKVGLKDKVVVMSYNVSPITSETRWIGDVYKEYNQKDKSANIDQPDYSFMINAITGERSSIQMKYSADENAEPKPFNEKKADAKYKKNSDEYKKLAKKFTEEGFGVKVASSEYDGVSALLAKVDLKTLKANPEKMMATRIYISIEVTDTEGVKYEVTLTEDTKELQSIHIIEPDGGSDYLG